MKIAYQSQQLKRLINEYPNKLDSAARKAMKQASKTISIAIKRDNAADSIPMKLIDARVRHYVNKNSATVFIGLNITPFRYFAKSTSELKRLQKNRPPVGISLLGKTVAGSFVGRGQAGQTYGREHHDGLLIFIRNGGRMLQEKGLEAGRARINKESISQVAVGVEDVLKVPKDYEIRSYLDTFRTIMKEKIDEIEP